jgi:hypothetical protein
MDQVKQTGANDNVEATPISALDEVNDEMLLCHARGGWS